MSHFFLTIAVAFAYCQYLIRLLTLLRRTSLRLRASADMGNLLDAPNTAKDSDRRKCNGLDVGVTGMQGWRLEMEDAHIAEEIGSRKDHVFLAVFDGHGGAGAAIYAENHMVGTLEKTEQWKQYLAGDAQDIALLGEALKVAFVQLDQDIKKHQEQSGGQDTSGCTSVTAVITPRYIICANAGDSRCCLGENGRAEPMSIDHKPYDDEERRRIEEAGGTVQWKRVDGDLAVSRALGDFQYKNRPDLPADKQKVSCVPEIRVWERKPTDEVLLLACDGLWDVMSNEEAIEELRAIFQSGESNAMLVAEEMIDVALEKGSRDNISAVVVTLPGASFASSGEGVAGLRARREASKSAQASQGSNPPLSQGPN